eukprot:1139976-Pelagomonas_calceolata.AAC.1
MRGKRAEGERGGPPAQFQIYTEHQGSRVACQRIKWLLLSKDNIDAARSEHVRCGSSTPLRFGALNSLSSFERARLGLGIVARPPSLQTEAPCWSPPRTAPPFIRQTVSLSVFQPYLGTPCTNTGPE